jgi:hypothetical protein
MARTVALPDQTLQAALSTSGFAFVDADLMRHALAAYGPLADWGAFARSWDDLELDEFMADGGRYRRRRHAVYVAGREGDVEPRPGEPHYQALDYNPLNGGVARSFAPLRAATASSESLRTTLDFSRALFNRLAPATRSWWIEVHQFRIEARPGAAGRPTPEGMHRDGVDYVLVLLVSRRNIASGTTAIHAFDGTELGRFTLTAPLDAALVDDARVSHGVTPVEALDAAQPAHRDVLVVTFRDADARARDRE